MQIQSKGGSMVLDYYPTKNAYNVINPDKVLKVLTFKGQTMIKRVISMQEYAVSYTHLTLPTSDLV